MARIGRIVVPGFPHHVTQRGNGRRSSSHPTAHLFQGRFASVVLDEAHFVAAASYIALNPVRAPKTKL